MAQSNEREAWLAISEEGIDADEVTDKVLGCLNQRGFLRNSDTVINPEATVGTLWREMIAAPSQSYMAVTRQDCDIVPRDYTIDWRVPILGPIHALIRRLINAEIRRYLMPAMEQQSYLNRQLLRTLNDLRKENDRLRRRIDELQGDDQESPRR